MLDAAGRQRDHFTWSMKRTVLSAARDFARLVRTPVFLVGGAVRDQILGQTPEDFDFAVAANEERFALFLQERGYGRAVQISRSSSPFPLWRLSRGGLTIDVACWQGLSIEDDLARRDFTVNAMARRVGQRAILDPFDGRQDIERHLLRAVSEKNLHDDPLRVLRGYRLAATLGFQICPGTRRLLRKHAGKLCRPSAERTHEEIVRMFGARSPGRAIAAALKDGVLAAALGVALPSLPASAVSPFSTAEDRLAVLFLRAGLAGSRLARTLARKKFSREEVRQISLRLNFFRQAMEGKDPARLLFHYRHEWKGLRTFLRGAARTTGERRRAVFLQSLAHRCRFSAAPVTGDDIRKWAGEPEGPRLGKILEEVRFQYFIGAWTSRRQIIRRLIIDRRAAVR